MIKHLPFNEFDMSAITNAVSRYKDAGLLADYNIEKKAAGVVSILFENPTTRDGSLVVFEVHKLAGRGWFGVRARWVVQLRSRRAEGATTEKQGCVAGRMLTHALTEAENDALLGFRSTRNFESALKAN
jgi:hypothetical protein